MADKWLRKSSLQLYFEVSQPPSATLHLGILLPVSFGFYPFSYYQYSPSDQFILTDYFFGSDFDLTCSQRLPLHLPPLAVPPKDSVPPW